MKLPVDDPKMWGDLPLTGHISSMRYDDERRYWKVERLVELSKELEPFQADVDELIERIKSGTWFVANQKVSIGDLLGHVDRALKAEAFPIILSSEGRVMDGSHRLVGAKIRGETEIAAVQFETTPEPDHIEKLL